MSGIKNEIESSIRKLDRPRSSRLIRKFIKLHSEEAGTCLQAAKYFLRIGDFQGALRMINNEVPKAWSKMKALEQENEIFLVRILNTLGASETALRYIDRLPASAKEKFKEHLFPIYFHNYLDELALPTLTQSQSKADCELTYTEQMDLIYAADAYSDMGRIQDATALLTRIEKIAKESLLKVRIHRILGQIAIKNNNLDEAKSRLQDSLTYLNLLSAAYSEDIKRLSIDHGILFAAFAEYHAHRGDFAIAREFIAKSLKILYVGNYKPEIWLHIVFIRGFIDFLETKKFPKDWEYILTYPSQRNPFRKLISEYAPIPNSIPLTQGKNTGPFLEYNLFFETKIEHRGSEKIFHLGFDLLDRTIITLLACGELGVSQFRLYEILWPDEYFSTRQCIQRIGQLVTRLRRQGFQVNWKDMHLQLEDTRSLCCLWHNERGPRGGIFLEMHPHFSREEVQAFFEISKSSALNQISEWLLAGYIQKSASNKKSRYKCVYKDSKPIHNDGYGLLFTRDPSS